MEDQKAFTHHLKETLTAEEDILVMEANSSMAAAAVVDLIPIPRELTAIAQGNQVAVRMNRAAMEVTHIRSS